jgi:DNA-binding transcriptional ArsR family regulator
VAAKQRFTRIPKTSELISAGVPTEVIPTYCALADYTNNKTGLCWPKMATLASTLGRSVRTVQRHLHVLKSKGLVEFVERRRNKGRYSSYLYQVVHIVRTTGHGCRVGGRSLYKRRTKFLPLFTGVRGRVVLRTSPLRSSKKFAPPCRAAPSRRPGPTLGGGGIGPPLVFGRSAAGGSRDTHRRVRPGRVRRARGGRVRRARRPGGSASRPAVHGGRVLRMMIDEEVWT